MHDSPQSLKTPSSMGMLELPDNLQKYSQVPSTSVFTATTIPSGLQKDHNTKAGVWGVIRVFKGKLEYTIEGAESYVLSPDRLGVVEPQRKHRVRALSDDLEFVVEFHREIAK